MDSDRFRFGLFEFCLTIRELRREGALLRLQSQPARVLGCLLQHAGQVVSREQLQREVWGDSTFVDFERGLNFCMAQIRSALDDDPAAPRFIRTIPKRGYQFVAPVELVAQTAAESPEVVRGGHKISPRLFIAGVFASIMLLGITFAAGYRLKMQQAGNRLPVVAVVRFDNETTNPDMTSFSDGLTDCVVERLASLNQGQYKVIGNAQILRRPREERDLKSIASTLGAGYVVLGQVQRNGSQTRILAHLIRLSDQTHIWVVRVDRALDHPLEVESEVAQKVATEFSPRVAKDASGSALSEAPSH
ncbi:MAG TPA: winged helix-turn-helix domain-containing protein [Candidatus Acidoferrum sp.]|nr:winged helix-turn-helix domain-containing protein [Candidatus Acidoferrum sp.]